MQTVHACRNKYVRKCHGSICREDWKKLLSCFGWKYLPNVNANTLRTFQARICANTCKNVFFPQIKQNTQPWARFNLSTWVLVCVPWDHCDMFEQTPHTLWSSLSIVDLCIFGPCMTDHRLDLWKPVLDIIKQQQIWLTEAIPHPTRPSNQAASGLTG